MPLLLTLPQPVSVPPISELGPDALKEPRTVDEFYNSLSKKKIGIKALLLDQVLMVLLCSLKGSIICNAISLLRPKGYFIAAS